MKKLLLLLIMLFICLTACGGETFPYHVVYNKKGGFGFDKEKNTFLVCESVSSRSELIELCEKYDNHYFDDDFSYANEEIPMIIRSYDESFFNNKDLIIVVTTKNDSFNYKIKGIDINGQEIIINLKKKKLYGTFTDEAYSYMFIIEIEKVEHNSVSLKIIGE